MAAVVPRLDGAQRLLAEHSVVHQRGIGVVFDQRHVVLLAQAQQGLFVGVGHDAARRVLQVRHHRHGLDARRGAQRQLHCIDRDAGARAGGDLQRLQPQALQRLQQPIKRGRLHRNRVAGVGHGTQGQVQRLGTAVGHLDVAGRKTHACAHRALGQHLAELQATLRRRGAHQLVGVLAQSPQRGLLQRFGRVQLRCTAGDRQVGLETLQAPQRQKF